MVNVTIIGGQGKVALRLAKILSSRSHTITPVVRTPDHFADLTSLASESTGSIYPRVLSLEESPASEFTSLFESTKADVVYFTAGSGGKGGDERTKKVDYEGAVKIFDAIEGVKGERKPYLVLISGIDIRDESKIPKHYNDADFEVSKVLRAAIPVWVKWKYAADLELQKRSAFKWFILRPGYFSEDAGTGKGDIGVTHISNQISRDDAAETLALFADDASRREKAAGLSFDLVGGDVALEKALDTAIEKGESAWIG